MNNIDFKKLGDYVKIKTGKLDANASSEDGEYPFFTCSIEPLKISSYSYDCECCLVAGNGDLNVKYYNGKFDAYQRTYIIESLDKERQELPWDVKEQVDINIKYDGYIRRQLKQVEQFKKLESRKIPEDLDYEQIGSLRIEARQKLEAYRPISIGQASRISGVSPADISVLLVYLSSK